MRYMAQPNNTKGPKRRMDNRQVGMPSSSWTDRLAAEAASTDSESVRQQSAMIEAAAMAACSSIPTPFTTKASPHQRSRVSSPRRLRLPATPTPFRQSRSPFSAFSPATRLRPRASVSASAAPSKDYEASCYTYYPSHCVALLVFFGVAYLFACYLICWCP